jgi:DNA repair exonuclease SbcCD ATPase subunit
MTDDELAETVEQLASRVDVLEEELTETREELADERDRRRRAERAAAEAHREREQLADELERVRARFDARTDLTREVVGELQSRELEKGAHLQAENVEPMDDVHDVDGGRLERFEKSDGVYMRLPGADDALERGGETTLARGDLLPVQQLAQLDDDMLASESRPARLAVWAWQQRDDSGPYSLWSKGSGEVAEYVDAGDLADEIRAKENGVSREYAKKLASRTIDALLDFTKDRLYVETRNRRADGLHYKERRLVLPSDAEIPGESDPRPETADVAGD